MSVFIDADACPVVNETIKIAKRFNLEITIICDMAHVIEKKGAKTIVVSTGADSVDFKLVNLVSPNDIVVTQDYGLAAMVLSRKGKVINQNGMIYSDGNIEQLLQSRYVAQKIRNEGGRLKGPKKRNLEQTRAFEEMFAQLCQSVAKNLL
ncbi:MAG: YaiI/YqxD family protein [Turicibacter sp.]